MGSITFQGHITKIFQSKITMVNQNYNVQKLIIGNSNSKFFTKTNDSKSNDGEKREGYLSPRSKISMALWCACRWSCLHVVFVKLGNQEEYDFPLSAIVFDDKVISPKIHSVLFSAPGDRLR